MLPTLALRLMHNDKHSGTLNMTIEAVVSVSRCDGKQALKRDNNSSYRESHIERMPLLWKNHTCKKSDKRVLKK